MIYMFCLVVGGVGECRIDGFLLNVVETNGEI